MSKSIPDKFKKFYNRHEEKITIAIAIFCIVVTFVSSFLLTFKVFQKPLTNEQIGHLKEVAYDVYYDGANVLYEADYTSDVNLELKSDNITIRPSDTFFRGVITATPENGTLSFEYNKEIIPTILMSIVIGLWGCLLELLFLFIFLDIVEKKGDSKRKNKFN